MLRRSTVWALGLALVGCGDGGSGRDEGGESGGVLTATDSLSGGTAADGGAETGGMKFDVGGNGGGCQTGDVGCTDKIDLLFVIDNSGTMGEEQINLARNFPLLIQQLEALTDSAGTPINPDVQIMVTTSDFGNPACTQFEKMDYTPAQGAPINTNCNSRPNRFEGLGANPVMIPQACTGSCPDPTVAITGDFIKFTGPNPDENNVTDVPAVDINGDGVPDSEVAQALACIGPQGIDGCGFEAPLENMMQALDPNSPWNQGPEPFVREEALLAIAVVTDEADCSVRQWSVMDDPMYQNIDPGDGMPDQTSAICWNAGVSCMGPDAMGVYSSCVSTDNGLLHSTNRYIDHLVTRLRGEQSKEVIMLGILGVPVVTARNPEAPFQPTAGGVFDLVYRDWRDGQWDGSPGGGDILPTEFMAGVTAADKQFDFGIGPGCTGQDMAGALTGQAIPPVRIKEVCESLNIADDPNTPADETGIRCCIESICDDDFSPAIRCLTGIIQDAIRPPG